MLFPAPRNTSPDPQGFHSPCTAHTRPTARTRPPCLACISSPGRGLQTDQEQLPRQADLQPLFLQPQVKLLEVMEGMDKETFEFKFGKELTFTTVLSDQQVVELVPGGAGIVVGYEDRSRFIQLVQKARLEESKEQVACQHWFQNAVG